MACAASLQRDEPSRSHYCALAARARAVYVSRLWNGRYLDYDSSGAAHSCSIMADMLAGQWYARACALPPLVTPQMALSCFRSIYAHNVIQFGEGRFKGAVNGMKPSRYADDSHMRNRNNRTSNGKSYSGYCDSGACDEDGDGGLGAGLNGPGLGVASLSMPIDVVLADLTVVSAGRVDSCCMQSREVWCVHRHPFLNSYSLFSILYLFFILFTHTHTGRALPTQWRRPWCRRRCTVTQAQMQA
jgi:hypothetical protein